MYYVYTKQYISTRVVVVPTATAAIFQLLFRKRVLKSVHIYTFIHLIGIAFAYRWAWSHGRY